MPLMKRSIVISLLALWSIVFTSASAQSVLRTYYADDLVRIPGLIQLSPGFTTVLDFWDTVRTLASARSELLRVESAGPRILLSATQPAGRTDLVVEIGGRTLLFTLEIGPGVGPRRYVIELTRPRRSEALPSPAHVPPARAPAQAPRPVPAPPAVEAPLPRPQATPPTVAEVVPFTPEQVGFTTAAQVPASAMGRVTIFFTLENRGDRTLAADPGRLVISQSGNPVTHIIKREPLRSLINPGESQSGLITLDDVRAGEISLHWTLVQIGTGRTLVITRAVMAGTRFELEGR